jgi:3-hydroxybutyrate dehydrogenase
MLQTAKPMMSPVPDMRPLANKTALVTGSTSGIGLGVAEALAAQGASIVLHGLGDQMEIEIVRARIAAEHNVLVGFHGADLSDPDNVDRMMKETQETVGSVDILVNNAGIQHVAPVDEFPMAKWHAIIAINLTAAFVAIRAAIPKMKARGYGRIINIASAHGLVGSPFKSAYVAAKHGIVGLTKVVALETAELNITCNAICPGYVYTPLVEKQIADQAKAHNISRERVISEVLLASQPNKRFAQVSEIGALAAFLATENGQSITGAALPVEGGWTAH